MEYCLLHGLGQSPADWAAVEAGLPGQKILCPDLAAWWADRPVTYESLLEGLEAQCAGREEAMVLCGCSLGAILALDYAWRHPRQVSALVLIAPRVRMPRGLLRLQNGVFRLLPARAFAGQGMGKDQVISLTRSMLALDLTPALDAVCQPTLVLCGEKDRVNQSAAREIAREIRLRNLSGIILIDFINMQNPDHQDELFHVLQKHLRKDTVKCTAVDITPLHILEMTRQKVRRPVIEDIHSLSTI